LSDQQAYWFRFALDIGCFRRFKGVDRLLFGVGSCRHPETFVKRTLMFVASFEEGQEMSMFATDGNVRSQ